MNDEAATIQFQLPDWTVEYIRSYTSSTNVEHKMSFVIDASHRNIIEKTGGPFAAAIFEKDTGALVSLGVNLVITQGMSILHAEMVAIAIAQKKLNCYDLGSKNLPTHELVTSSEPCAMCFGAIPWSGVRRIVTGARDSDIRSVGFDEGPKMEHWKQELEKRSIEVITDIHRDNAASVLTDYAQHNGKIYNSREST